MIRKHNPNQLYLEDFKTQFGGRLRKDNRWVRQAEELPWDVIEDEYASNFSEDRGIYAKNGRIAFGAIYIQEVTGLPDRNVVEYIQENPYVQYFLGLREFTDEPLFDASLMVHYRKRFPADFIKRINQIMSEPEVYEKLAREAYRKARKERDKDGGKGDPPAPSGGGTPPPEEAAAETMPRSDNRGKLILDATVAPADIRYPSDLSLQKFRFAKPTLWVAGLLSGSISTSAARTWKRS